MWRLLQLSYRHALPVALVVLALTFVLSRHIGALNIRVSSEELIPEDSPLKAQYEAVRADFGSDQIAIIYVGDKALFTEQRLHELKTLHQQLKALPEVERIESLFTSSNISSEDGWVDTTPPFQNIPKTQAEILARRDQVLSNPLLKRSVISHDGNATALTLYLRSPEALADLAHQRLADLNNAPSNGSGSVYDERAKLTRYLDPDQYAQAIHADIETLLSPHRSHYTHLFQLGSPAVQVQMANYITRDQIILLPLSMLVMVVLLGLMMRSFQGALVPVLNALISASWTLGAMALLDVPINMLNYIVPALILVIGATEDIHLLVEYREALARKLKGMDAIDLVGRNIGLTLALTGLTTVLGFAATGLTDIKIMRDFGLTAALGMSARFAVSVGFLPAYLRLFGRHLTPATGSTTQSAFGIRFSRFVMERIVPHPYRALFCFGTLTVIGGYSATNLRMGNDLMGFLEKDAPLVTQTHILSDQLAGTKVLYLTLEGSPGDFKQARHLRKIERISTYLRGLPELDTVTSLADYLSLVNREMHDGDPQTHHIPAQDNLIAQYLLLFHHDSMLAPYVTGDYARANIIIRSNLNDSHDLNALVAHIRGELDSGIFGPIVYTLTGKSVMVAQAVDQLAQGQSASIAFMALALFGIIAILFLSLKAASMTVLSNLFAVIVVFGIMGLLGIPLNVGTCMVAAITIGIGIDDTLHLMVRYNKELKARKNEHSAIEAAMVTEFKPVVITSLGLMGGFGVLAGSSFVPVMQFGLLSALVIFLALVADLILTPILLSKTRLITLWDLLGLHLRQALMNGSPFFRDMSPVQAKKLILASDVENYPENTRIIKTGDQGNKMYVILEGEMEVSIELGGNPILLSYLSTGDVFGEIALISTSKRTADVTAKTPVKLLVYDWEALIKLRRFSPYLASKLLLNLANILGQRLVDSQRKLDANPHLAPITRIKRNHL